MILARHSIGKTMTTTVFAAAACTLGVAGLVSLIQNPSPDVFATYGAPGLVAFLVWWLTTKLDRRMEKLDATLNDVKGVLAKQTSAIKELADWQPEQARR